MKFIFAAAILLSSLSSFADENALNTAVDTSSETKTYTMEPTISMSSINEGTKFIGVALLADVVSWFSIGLEGDLPLEFEKQDQIYNARILGRFHLLKTYQNNIFVQAAITQGFYNGNDVTEFATVGAAIGFMQNINESWDIGARLGAEYAQARFENGFKTDQDTFYNRLSVVGAYHF